MVNLVDKLREISVNDILNTPSMKKTWPKWKTMINQNVGDSPSATSVLDLGDKLATIFKNTSISGRSQSILKAGGVRGNVLWHGILTCAWLVETQL